MVTVAPRRRSLAARPAAVAVTSLERLAHRAGDHPPRTADVDDHRLLVEEDPGHAAVAGHALKGGRGDGERELHLCTRRPGESLQGLDACRHLDIRGLAA